MRLLQVEIPSNDTTYWCNIHSLPDEIATQERYIYKVFYTTCSANQSEAVCNCSMLR
jgi:hypothetical protein